MQPIIRSAMRALNPFAYKVRDLPRRRRKHVNVQAGFIGKQEVMGVGVGGSGGVSLLGRCLLFHLISDALLFTACLPLMSLLGGDAQKTSTH